MNRTALSQPPVHAIARSAERTLARSFAPALGPLLARAVLIGSIACAPLAFAGGEIVKCVGSDGSVTLTDEACAAGERSMTVVAAPAAQFDAVTEPVIVPQSALSALAAQTAPLDAPAAGRTPVRARQLARAVLPGQAVMRHSLPRFDPPSRALARDVSTLKAARQAMLLLDSAAQSLRAQRLAGLQ